MKCVWCDSKQAKETTKDCQWIEPGGVEVIMVTGIPAIECSQCQDVYLADEMNEEIEVSLNTVDLRLLGSTFSYEQLVKAPKMSIFDIYNNGGSFKCR
ncbi:YokU family protein [Ammoniphilus sp. CFH 90114]|uniref:YokU family protein n=1 Tax=Ammoniphilus sp. CFH 90114 TaxID=2493665 RepID=UPI0013E93AF3|nr:YokU family protein [Ammoniphilus sp. CFH 90114]